MPSPGLHLFLQYSQHAVQRCALLWDLREPPASARHASAPSPLSEFELSQHATNPPVACLRVTCGIFPEDSWVAEAWNGLGVTVRDVLDAIHTTVYTQITYPEWYKLCPKQQHRVNLVFDARWRRSADPARAREMGVLRADCLLRHVSFAGMTAAPDNKSEDSTYLLTVGHPKR
ncbi:ectomycorrhiza-regulated small secreted protein [Mycena belliarum]|uniref:Ectomycorrhiza-regulated small secreted protein n=1 Tax=Mycena belliarum TaxID=1033014 RepID=A0AAD6UJ35_9AGAR|nr:ectomycorrhiza-regulated small secreted protein [Mycena belliae]